MRVTTGSTYRNFTSSVNNVHLKLNKSMNKITTGVLNSIKNRYIGLKGLLVREGVISHNGCSVVHKVGERVVL